MSAWKHGSEWMATRYAAAKEAGICVKCDKAAVSGSIHCKRHLRLKRNWEKAARLRRKNFSAS